MKAKIVSYFSFDLEPYSIHKRLGIAFLILSEGTVPINTHKAHAHTGRVE